MQITIKQISDMLDRLNMKLLKSYTCTGSHVLCVFIADPGSIPESITVWGVKFAKVDHFCDSVTYRCVFSGEVLQNSVKVNFECTK